MDPSSDNTGLSNYLPSNIILKRILIEPELGSEHLVPGQLVPTLFGAEQLGLLGWLTESRPWLRGGRLVLSNLDSHSLLIPFSFCN